MPSYIPQREAALKSFAVNFASLITATPANYALSAGNATTIQDAVDDFVAAYDTANEPTTRTNVTVANKDAMRIFMLDIIRPFAQLVRNNAGVSNELKTGLGLTIKDTVPTPVATPVTQPLVSIIAATPLSHTLRFSDAATPDKRAKPFGAKFIEVRRWLGPTPAASYEDWPCAVLATKNPVGIDYDAGSAGKLATYVARWVTGRGLMGPWSAVVSMIVVA